MPIPMADPPGTVLATAVVAWVITMARQNPQSRGHRHPHQRIGAQVPDRQQPQGGQLLPGHGGDRGPRLGQVDLGEQVVEDGHHQHQRQHTLDNQAGPGPATGCGHLLLGRHSSPALTGSGDLTVLGWLIGPPRDRAAAVRPSAG